MNHLHTFLYLEGNGFIQVSLDSPGNVYLMKDSDYKKYVSGEEFVAVGGLVKARKKVIRAPQKGNWHLVIDNNQAQESLNVAINITNGRQIAENEIEQKQTTRRERNKSLKGKEKPVSDKEHEKLLRREITKKLKEMDPEGLKFLINQAKLLIQKKEMEESNDDYVVHAKTKKKKNGKEKDDNDYVVHAKKNRKKAGGDKGLVNIEEHSENTFILVLCGARKTLSRQELRIIVKMCHTPVSDSEFSGKLFEWLKIHRNDILFDARIRTADHPVWPILRRFLRNRYKAK